mgnify:FL=1|jgi:hypothetical protein
MVACVGATMSRATLANGLEILRQALAVTLAVSAIKALTQRRDHGPGLGFAGKAGQLVDQGIGLWALDVQ